uniref:Uncharacterized protein n=1 Tax=Arundo donax TaxID=35708 RepID=A0A0A8ZNS4_ARUDO
MVGGIIVLPQITNVCCFRLVRKY